ncbi:phosphotransferase family protein [Halosimplex salinum]|uniref:phosphotransferase family protein n=1 Tax=Halosimplex salinum TaxID=1710538 RepID=UPI000F47B751|nr:phosphotransferase [Halosimplex salinum]
MQTTSAADIEAVLDESGPDYEEFRYEPATGGTRADVYLVTLVYRGNEYEVVVKFKPAGDDRFAVEPKLHDYVADRTDLPIPRILVFKQEPERNVPPYFVTERVRGDNLADQYGAMDQALWERVIEQVGRIMGDLHSEIAFEAFGRLMLYDDRITIENWRGNWQEYFADLTESHIDRLSETPFEGVESRAREAFEDTVQLVPEDGMPRLVHDDMQPTNLLCMLDEPEPITAVLDWQDTLAAHRDYQVAQSEFLYIDSTFDDPTVRETLREKLYEGYREHHEFEPDERYEQCKPIYQLSTLLWRMTGFDDAFAEDDLGRARAEFQYRQQFDRLLAELPR